MRVMIPTSQDRISPLLDVSRLFLLVDLSGERELGRREVWIEDAELSTRAKKIRESGPNILICGAVSRPLESMLVSAGIRLIPNTCGPVETVLHAFISDGLTESAFLMPGCCGKRRRIRGHRGGKRR